MRKSFAIALALAVSAFAQSDRGVITGTVVDPAGALVPGAKVTAADRETGRVSETATTGTGNFTLPSLPAGLYDLAVDASGFKKSVRPDVVVQVAQTVRVDFALQVGAASESVTVTVEAPLLRTENSEQSINVTGDRSNALPMNFGGGSTGPTGGIRNWLSFAMLAPGVSGTAYNSPINGSPGGAFKIYLEGQDVTSSNDTTWTSIVSAASVESIGEFSLQTSNFAAEFGQVLGGVPASRNNLRTLTFQGNTRMNRVPGQPLFTMDPNGGSIDPNQDLVLNPNAWVDAAAGQWGFGAAYCNDCRWQHQVSENLNIGRRFQLRERISLQVLSGPSSANPLATPTYNSAGVPTSGFGYINANGIGGSRNGQVVARFQF